VELRALIGLVYARGLLGANLYEVSVGFLFRISMILLLRLQTEPPRLQVKQSRLHGEPPQLQVKQSQLQGEFPQLQIKQPWLHGIIFLSGSG
jgi:hypothetical protein